MPDLYLEHLKAEAAALRDGIHRYRQLLAVRSELDTAPEQPHNAVQRMADAAASVSAWEDKYRQLVPLRPWEPFAERREASPC